MLTFGVLDIRKLPSSLGKLRCLQTLNLALALTWRVHNMIWELEELRHLHLPVARQRRVRKFKIGRWKNLRTLKNFPLHNGDLECLGELTQLRELDVIIEAKDLTQRLVEAFSSALCNLRHLQSLSISGYELSETILDVTPILEALLGCPHFHKLELNRFRIKFPEDHRMIPPTVTHLELANAKFSEDPLLKLEKLPNLRFLSLCNVYWEGDSILNCTSQGFPNLVSLELYHPRFEKIIIAQGAMRRLERLELTYCEYLQSAPDGLQHIKTLQQLNFESMTKEFNDRLVRGGADYGKVKHVPSVLLSDPLGIPISARQLPVEVHRHGRSCEEQDGHSDDNDYIC